MRHGIRLYISDDIIWNFQQDMSNYLFHYINWHEGTHDMTWDDISKHEMWILWNNITYDKIYGMAFVTWHGNIGMSLQNVKLDYEKLYTIIIFDIQ